MNLSFRHRSMLLPVASILSGINNLTNAVFSTEDRKRLVIAAFIEHIGLGYGTVPLDRIIDIPCHEGRFSRVLTDILTEKHVKMSGIGDEIVKMRRTIFTGLHDIVMSYGLVSAAVRQKQISNEPGMFDHGYKVRVVSPKGKRGRNNGEWLLVEWVRPTLNMEEMSVNQFFLCMAKHLATRKQPVLYWLTVFHTVRLEAFLQIDNFEIFKTVLLSVGGE